MSTASTPRGGLTIGQAKGRFDTITLTSYDPQNGAVDGLEEVLQSYVGRPSGAPCGGAMLVAPHGTGKTRAIECLAARILADGDFPPEAKPVLHVEIPTVGTVESIPSAILAALGLPRPDLGKPEFRWLKALRGMREARVQLVAFDEFNRAARRPTMSRPIATSIRERIMDAGAAPVAFIGSEDASVVLNGCPELVERLDDRIGLEPLQWYLDYDKEIFLGLVEELGSAMVEQDLVKSSRLHEEDVAADLAAACAGRIRSLMKIVRAALGLCMEREADAISIADLEEATNRFAVSGGLIALNPFTKRA